jgi:hypothetical protein
MPDGWRETVLSLRFPVAQRYTFARYVLGEDRMSAAGLAGYFAPLGLMDGEEYDALSRGWNEPRLEAKP